MNRGFTLIELLVVMGLMGILGTASVGGYRAMQRGMEERGVMQSVNSLIRSAYQRAQIDRQPTAVYFWNETIRGETADENEIVVGKAVAIRRHGRLSDVKGTKLVDEFGDLDLTYEALSGDANYSTDGESHSSSELENRPGMRLWRFPTTEEMKYSIVADAVWCDASMTETLFSGGGAEGMTNVLMSAFYNLGRSKAEATWKVGDAYAFEIGEIRLPHGFIFGSKIPNDVSRDELVAVMLFDPESETDESVEVWSTKPNASGAPAKFKKAGTATSDEQKTM